MTREEAIKILDLNAGRLSNSVQMAIATLIRETSLPSDDDLEKYASRAGFDYVDDIENKYPGHRWNDHDVEFAYRDGIIAGAEWQKSKMLKAAVGGRVLELGETYKALSLSVESKELNEVLQPLGVKDGDKVRLVIIKEDSK